MELLLNVTKIKTILFLKIVQPSQYLLCANNTQLFFQCQSVVAEHQSDVCIIYNDQTLITVTIARKAASTSVDFFQATT